MDRLTYYFSVLLQYSCILQEQLSLISELESSVTVLFHLFLLRENKKISLLISYSMYFIQHCIIIHEDLHRKYTFFD